MIQLICMKNASMIRLYTRRKWEIHEICTTIRPQQKVKSAISQAINIYFCHPGTDAVTYPPEMCHRAYK